LLTREQPRLPQGPTDPGIGRYPSRVLDYLTSSLVTMIIVADPILLSALFLGLTAGMAPAHRREVAIRGPLIAFIILVVVGLAGARVLALLGISLSAFRIAGGLLLLWSAWEMVFDRRGQRLEATADSAITIDHVKDVAAFPLAIPLIAGPGAITAIILLAGRADGHPDYLVGLFAVTALVMLACFAAFLGAERISRFLGVTGRAVSTRMLGIILAAMAVQFVIDGIETVVPPS
jgi:multiple antibiotic resistance protein